MDISGYEYQWLVLIGIAVFFAIRLGVGYYASRKVSSAADFIVAGRRLPIYLAGASIMATWFAAEVLMGASSNAYQYGFQGVVFDPFGAGLCLLISGFFFIRLMRRARYLTLIDFFEHRYGRTMGFLISLVQLVTYFGWTAAQIVAGGNIVHALFGWPVAAGMILVATIVTVYTLMGGMWADTLLDFMQMFLTAGGITLVFSAVVRAIGGWDVLVANAGSMFTSKPFTLLPIPGEGYLGYDGLLGWTYWLAAWMAVGLGSIAAQDLMQRSMSARNEATSVWGTYMAAVLYIGFGVLSPLIGIGMFVLNPNLTVDQTEFVLVSAAMKYLTPILTSVFIAALASALMSTSDTSILAGASILSENILPFLRKKKMDGKAQLLWTRIGVVGMGVISLLLALYAETIYKLATFSWTVLLVGVFTSFAFGMYWKRANLVGAVTAFAAGFSTWLILTLVVLLPITLVVCEGDYEVAVWDAAYIGSVPALIVSIIGMVVGSLVTQKSNPPLPLRDVDGNIIEFSNRLGINPLWDALRKLKPGEEDRT